jgi:hypothetical protein
MTQLTPMLAINQVELIAAIFGIVIVVGGWISKAMQKGQQSGMNQGGLGADERRRKLEELAARRRQQLEDLARQRRAGAQTGAPTPSNLTAGEAQQRNTAREMYERRAEALRQLRQQQAQVQSGGTTFPSTSAPSAPPTSARPTPAPTASRSAPPTAPQQAQDLARQRAQQMARLRQKREQELAVQRQRARQEQERIARQQQARKPAPPPRREEPVLEAQAVLEEITETPAGGVRPEAFALTGRGRRGVAGLNAAAMRQAIILKEILDPPVSMREPRGL